jgi:ABC-2 type transport system permease protein
MRNLRLALLSGKLSFRSLFSWNTPSLFISVLIVTPILQLAFFAFLGNAFKYENFIFFVIGTSILGATSSSVAGLVGVIAEERRFGTLKYLMLSPASRIAVFIGRMAPGILFAVFVSIMTSTFGFLVASVKLDSVTVFSYLLIIVAASFSGACLGLMLSASGLIFRDIYQISNSAQLILLVASGASINIHDLPDWIQEVSKFLPLTHAISAGRNLVELNLITRFYWHSLFSEILIGFCFLGLALGAMIYFENRSRMSATIDLY